MLTFRVLQSDDSTILNLVQLYITVNEVTVTNPFTSVEAAAMGQLLYGLRVEQWKELVSPVVFSSILTQHLSQLDCSVNNTTALNLASKLPLINYELARMHAEDMSQCEDSGLMVRVSYKSKKYYL